MGGFFPEYISVHIAGRICHYIIFRNTRILFPLYLQIILPPPLISEMCALLFSTAHVIQGSWSPLLRHFNVKTFPCINVLVRTVVTASDLIPNCPHTRVFRHLTNGGY